MTATSDIVSAVLKSGALHQLGEFPLANNTPKCTDAYVSLAADRRHVLICAICMSFLWLKTPHHG